MSRDQLKAIAVEEIHELIEDADLLSIMETHSLDEIDADRVINLINSARVDVWWSE